jgi:hypothetical protein
MKCSEINKLVNEIVKEAMPQVVLKDKGHADLHFEWIAPAERKKFWEDLTSKDAPEIKLPDFGYLDDKFFMGNPNAKTISKDDLLRGGLDFIKVFVNDKRDPPHTFIEYDKQQHKFKLKPQYDLKKILEEIDAEEAVPA